MTRCLAFFSKSWIPIEMRASKFLRKMRRARPSLPARAISTAERGCTVAAVISTLRHFELDVARARPEMLAAVHHDGFAGKRFRIYNEPYCIYYVFHVGAAPKGREAMRALEPLLALLTAHQGDARRNAAYPYSWRKRHRQYPGCPFQADLGNGVGQEIGIQVEDFLVQHV